jgi:hypothetical protein
LGFNSFYPWANLEIKEMGKCFSPGWKFQGGRKRNSGLFPIAQDLMRCRFFRHRFGHHDNTALGLAVIGRAVVNFKSIGGDHVDYYPSAPFLNHLPGGCLRVKENAPQIHVHHLIPLRSGYLYGGSRDNRRRIA